MNSGNSFIICSLLVGIKVICIDPPPKSSAATELVNLPFKRSKTHN